MIPGQVWLKLNQSNLRLLHYLGFYIHLHAFVGLLGGGKEP